MEELLSPAQAAALLGVPVDTIKTRLKRGKIPFTVVQEHGKPVKKVSRSTIETLQSPQKDYETLWQQYLDELRAGIIGNRPCSDDTLENNKWAMKRFWKQLALAPTIEALSTANLAKVIASLGFDDENHRDFFASKDATFKAVTGFMRLLVRDGLKPVDELEAMKALKPRRKYKKSVRYPSAGQIHEAIRYNLCEAKGRRPHDIYLTNALLHLYGFAGLRKMEAATLKLKEIDFAAGIITFWGKGGKERDVPMHPALIEALQSWLRHRPESELSHLFLSFDGTPLTSTAINTRFRRLCKKLGADIMPHKLRHQTATTLLEAGTSPNFVQMLLGHSSIKTTELYNHSSMSAMVKGLRETWAKQEAAKKAPKLTRENTAQPTRVL